MYLILWKTWNHNDEVVERQVMHKAVDVARAEYTEILNKENTFNVRFYTCHLVKEGTKF
jgi:hypothetical protein